MTPRHHNSESGDVNDDKKGNPFHYAHSHLEGCSLNPQNDITALHCK